MAIASRLEKVNQWLQNVSDMALYLGCDGGTTPISQSRLFEIADDCEWAEIQIDNRLPGVFHQTLMIGRGDFLEWCRSGGKSENSKAYFITACNE